MKNLDVRTRINEYRLRHYEVAQSLGVSEYTLSVWLRTELPDEKRRKIFEAIEQLRVTNFVGV